MRENAESLNSYKEWPLEAVENGTGTYTSEPKHVDNSTETPTLELGKLETVTTSENSKKKKSSILSPLRYPGSKRRLAKYIGSTLEINELRPDLLVEPFAGGASVALNLLNSGHVEKIGLMDLDPLVSAFWQTTFFDTDWLVRQIESIEVTLHKWHKFKAKIPEKRRERALACLFLNRTSFSGILAPDAGPIGGQKQASAYGLDCRFPRQTLIERIRQAEALSDRVAFVWNASWTEGLPRIKRMQKKKNYLQTPSIISIHPFSRKQNVCTPISLKKSSI